jgi:hypothetical protein
VCALFSERDQAYSGINKYVMAGLFGRRPLVFGKNEE